MPLQGGLAPPLHMAVELGHADVVRVLLASGADKEARDEVRDLGSMHKMMCCPHVLHTISPGCLAQPPGLQMQRLILYITGPCLRKSDTGPVKGCASCKCILAYVSICHSDGAFEAFQSTYGCDGCACSMATPPCTWQPTSATPRWCRG